MRESTLTDLDRVVSWLGSQEETDLWSGGKVVYPIQIEQTLKAIEWHAAHNITIDDGAEVVAFGQLLEKPEQRLHLARLIVDPARRGSGFGNVLVESLIQKAKSLNAARLSLNVHPQNERAIGLYQKLGFRAVSSVPAGNPTAFQYMERVPSK